MVQENHFGEYYQKLIPFLEVFICTYVFALYINQPSSSIDFPSFKISITDTRYIFQKRNTNWKLYKTNKLFSRINQSNALLFLFLWQRIVCHDVLLVCKFISVYIITYFVYFVFLQCSTNMHTYLVFRCLVTVVLYVLFLLQNFFYI